MGPSRSGVAGLALALLAASGGAGWAPGPGARTGAASDPSPPPRPASTATGDTLVMRDDLGRTVRLDGRPERVVSLVPAATELLFALGAGDRLVGRTRYGVHPPAAREVPSVGQGIRPSLEMVLERSPDVVLLFAGPETRSTVERLEELGASALALRHNTFADLRRNVRRLGRLTGRERAAGRLMDRIDCQLRRVADAVRETRRPTVYYEVWADPPVTVGSGSYLDSLLRVAGARNLFGDLRAPSPRVGLEAVAARDPELVLVPRRGGEGRARRPTRRPGWDVVPAVREGRVRTVDGDLVHRLGPRVGAAAQSLAAAVHPGRSGTLRGLEMDGCGADRDGARSPGATAPTAPAAPSP